MERQDSEPSNLYQSVAKRSFSKQVVGKLTSLHAPYGISYLNRADWDFDRAENLTHVMYRMGILAALRSKQKMGMLIYFCVWSLFCNSLLHGC